MSTIIYLKSLLTESYLLLLDLIMIDKISIFNSRFIFVSFSFLFLMQTTSASAELSIYRSAGEVRTDGGPPYENVTGCQVSNDNLSCSRGSNQGYANLYFSSFGNLSTFGIPKGSVISSLHMRIKGKNTVTQHISISGTNIASCPTPADLWNIYLGPQDKTVELHAATSSHGVGNCINTNNIENDLLTFRINHSAGYLPSSSYWSADIDNFEIAFDYTAPNPSPTPTIVPTNTPIPTATPIPTPEPFLDLPWDYKKQDKTFEDVALDPFSWFDHQYPLQNYCCLPPSLIYNGKIKDYYYRSHSGYDYSRKNDVLLNTSVLAAASGYATFTPDNKSRGAGNIIKIDHGNGYQTWYEHLSWKNLTVNAEGIKILVNKGQKIGEVGMTGNTTGPHIHFSVFKDINDNGNFNDDYPYGLVDPLGWEGDYPDPWTEYGSGGAQSYNLFIDRAKPKEKIIPVSGGEFTTEDKKVRISVPDKASNTDFSLIFNHGPFESFSSNGKFFESIVPSFFLHAINSLGDEIIQFYAPIKIVYHYSQLELFNIKQTTLLLHFFNEQTQTWEPLPSVVDTENNTVTAETTHFSHFALMGEVKDNIPPQTEIVITGEKGQENWYRSDVIIELKGQDNLDGVGIEYTLYSLDGTDWQVYQNSLSITDEGEHTIEYQSIDKAGYEEERKTATFFIDKTSPEAEIRYDLSKFDTVVLGNDSSSAAIVTTTSSSLHPKYTISDQAGNTFVINTDKLKLGKQVTLIIKNFQYNNKTIIPFDKNILFTLVLTDKMNIVKQLDQYYSLKGDKKIFTNYLSSRNSTNIYSKSSGTTSYIKEEQPGIILLQLFTQNGTLKYRY